MRVKPRTGVAATLVALVVVSGFVVGTSLPGGGSSSPAAGTSGAAPAEPSASTSPGPSASPLPPPTKPVRPPAFAPTRLAPGERPPQFVVMSFDGAGNHDLFQHYLSVAERNKARFTFFLTGTYLLPEDLRTQYLPPGKPPGSSAVGFAARAAFPNRIADLTQAWAARHEIGTHFNGHFCDAAGVGTWDAAAWRSEITQFNDFLDNWRARVGTPALKPLPFDHTEVVGGRTPCLDGRRDQMLPVFKEFGYRYDASDPGKLRWPVLLPAGLWQFPLQAVNRAGTDKQNLSMDYNFYVNQSGGKDVAGDSARAVEQQTYDSLLNAYNAVHTGNRAPLFVGSHFNLWSEGAYRNALTRFADAVCTQPDTRCISNRDLADWLDAQDPAVLAALQAQPIQGQ